MRATESVISWIGKGVVMPARSRASAISGRTPSSLKVVRILPVLLTIVVCVSGLPRPQIGLRRRPAPGDDCGQSIARLRA
jgi:hypothetical protein